MSSSGAQSLAVCNLELLRAVEDTVDSLVADTGLVTSVSRTYSELDILPALVLTDAADAERTGIPTA